MPVQTVDNLLLQERFRMQKFLINLVDKFKRESNLTVAPRDEEGAFSAPPFSIKNNAPYGNVPNLIFQVNRNRT
jgi:hypothetical protein